MIEKGIRVPTLNFDTAFSMHHGSVTFLILKPILSFYSNNVYWSLMKKNENAFQSKKKKMAESIITGDHRNLWYEARKFRNKSNKVPAVIDGETSADTLTQLFPNKFDKVYNSVGLDKNAINDVLDNIEKHI